MRKIAFIEHHVDFLPDKIQYIKPAPQPEEVGIHFMVINNHKDFPSNTIMIEDLDCRPYFLKYEGNNLLLFDSPEMYKPGINMIVGHVHYEDELTRNKLADMLTSDDKWLREYAKRYIKDEVIPL